MPNGTVLYQTNQRHCTVMSGSSSSKDKSYAVEEETMMAEEQEDGVVAVLTLLEEYAHQHGTGQESQSLALWNLTKARRVVQGRSSSVLVQHEITAHAIRRNLDATATVLTTVHTAAATTTTSTSKDDDAGRDEEGDEDDPELLPEDVGRESASTITEKNGENGQPCLSASRIAFTFVVSNRSSSTGTDKNEEMCLSTLPAASVEPELVLVTAATTGLRQRKRTGTVTAEKTNQPVVNHPQAETTTLWSVEDVPARAANGSAAAASTTTAANPTTQKSAVDPLLLFSPLPPAELRLARDQAVQALTAYCGAATLAAAILTALAATTSHQQQQPCGLPIKQPHE